MSPAWMEWKKAPSLIITLIVGGRGAVGATVSRAKLHASDVAVAGGSWRRSLASQREHQGAGGAECVCVVGKGAAFQTLQWWSVSAAGRGGGVVQWGWGGSVLPPSLWSAATSVWVLTASMNWNKLFLRTPSGSFSSTYYQSHLLTMNGSFCVGLLYYSIIITHYVNNVMQYANKYRHTHI